MYLLRRAAVRTLSQQPTRHLSTLRATSTRITVLQSTKPTLYRPFHQARIWQAQEHTEAGERMREEIAAADEAAGVTGEAAAEDAVAEAAAESEPLEPAEAQAQGELAQSRTPEDSAAANATSSAAPPSPFSPTQSPPSSGTAAGSSFRNAQPSRILYVGNLFFEVTAAQLETEFSRFGRVTNSRIVTDARSLSKGFGYVEFEAQESADRATREMDQKVFQGRRMAVQYHVRRDKRTGSTMANKEPNAPSKTLFIGNMSYQMSDRDLNDLFREIRDVLDVRVAIDRRSGQPRGFAHADFVDIPSAQRAKEHLENKVVYGRQLRVDYSQSSGSTQNA